MALISGSAQTTSGNQSPPPPVVVTGSPPPPIVVTGGGGGDPPEGCPPSMPANGFNANSPTVQNALATANQNSSAVDRAAANWNTIVSAANAHNIDPALLAAIGVRETGFRDINQIGGGDGRGVFQIDIGKHPDVSEAQANDLNFAANYAANLLQQNMQTLANNFPNFTPAQLEQATAASYNSGPATSRAIPLRSIKGRPRTIMAPMFLT